ncbi:MAG TPA: hypothetical protein PLC99_09575 [Verrucomicrobiota bacterium]|nr:hypothetical protein [Verrucomicrobiota bacterium]
MTDWESCIPKACQHAKMLRTAFDAASKRWPRELEKVARKRARRRAWLKAHGTLPQDWTPPDPNDRRTANYPGAALLKRVPLAELRRRLETEFPELFAGSPDGSEIPDESE